METLYQLRFWFVVSSLFIYQVGQWSVSQLTYEAIASPIVDRNFMYLVFAWGPLGIVNPQCVNLTINQSINQSIDFRRSQGSL